MNADGTFTYTAPVLDHSTSDTLEDYIYYQASDGTDNSVWQKISLNVNDTTPTATSDQDSVGYGGIASGNLITGTGGNDVQADTLVIDTTFDANGNLSITTDNGILTVKADGTYKYDSAYAIGSVTGSNATDWNNAQIDYYGINSGDPFASSTTLDTSVLTQTNKDKVDFTNSNGLGVTGATDDKVDGDEFIVFNLNGKVSTADVTLTNFGSGENVDWYAYNELGELVGSGTKQGNGNDILNIVSDQTPTNGTTFIQYIVLDPASNSEIRVETLSYNIDSSLNINDDFTYELTDADGDTSSTTLAIKHDVTPVGVNDTATVYESALDTGTDSSSTNEVATGNLFTNDLGIASGATITDINGTSAS